MATKQELTSAFVGKELTATDIRVLVNQYKYIFKDIAFLDNSDFILDNLSSEELDILNINMSKVNTYYKMGLIKKYLYPEKIDYYSEKAFAETGHNKLDVKPLTGLGLEFVFGSKTFLKPVLQ
ncbi:MAG: hypothetical protein IPJ51_16865 [Saprospiraceae bacterium]|nr:hypothetical protein [Saprospiraceae bacterium]